jgi:hypothetical protein
VYIGVDVVDVLLGVNTLVFAGWWVGPPRFMNNNFVCSLRNWREVRRGTACAIEGWPSLTFHRTPLGAMVDVDHASIQSPEHNALSVK